MKKVLVTGAYGYIGSHVCKLLHQHGYDVHALDKAISTNDISPYISRFICHDIREPYGDRTALLDMHDKYDAVVHLASLISVEDSMIHPIRYIENNVIGTKKILSNVFTDNVIFASTASAFNPVSTYAQTKLLGENLIRRYAPNYTIFRFYNVAGSGGEFSQIGKATHLIRIAAEAAAGKRDIITINGSDWDTEDGTCERDYVHVVDLSHGILKAIVKPSNKYYECTGTGTSYSVREVINVMREASKQFFKVEKGPRREGDVARIQLDSDQISDYLDCRHNLYDMCKSAYEAELRRVG